MFEIILIPVVLLLALFFYLTRGRNENQPPGPEGSILFGVQFEVEFETMYQKLYEWSLKYGEIFQFNLMGNTFVSLNSSDALRDAFCKEPNATITAGRPPMFVGKYLYDNYSVLSFASYSEKWIKRRKLHHEILHAYGEGLKDIENQIQYNLRHLKEELTAFEGREQNPADFIEEFILGTVEIMLIGRAFGKEGELQKLMKTLVDLDNKITNPGMDFLYMTFPFLRYLPLSMSRVIDEYLKTKQRLQQLLMSHLETGNSDGNEKHGVLFKMRKSVNDNKKLENPWFTERHMKASAVDLLVAAYLTTRGTLVSMVQLLAKRPDLQKKLQEEIDEVIGPERDPNMSDRQKCPLNEAVIFETLRYISHAPLSLLHETTKPCTINGYDIQKGVTIIPNLWTIHHCEKYWGDPFSYRPERFLDEKRNLLPSTAPERIGLHVFGLGKRSCVGEVFAKSRIFLFLATLMQTYTIQEPMSENLPDLLPNDMLPGITLQPRPYKVTFARRTDVQ